MKQRTITAAIIMAVVLAAFLLREVNGYIFDALLCLVIIVSANEVARVFNRSGRVNDSTLITFYPILNFILFYFCLKSNMYIKHILLLSLALIVALMLVETVIVLCTKKQLLKQYEEYKTTKTFASFCVNKVLLTGFIMLYPAMILGSLHFFNHISDFTYLNIATKFPDLNISLFLLLITIVTTIANDIFAYLIGSAIKGPKLCPLISPNKTISGAIGGLLGGVVFGFGVYAIFMALGLTEAMIPAYIIIIYTIIAGIISQLGDIFASIIKRKARTKDYSSIFPGHGGFMDRLDGISFNSIFSLVFFMLFIF
ncbi:MAG: hypothetical protein E7359_00950 [Clostridiales bacterium]|nr:hypothetical protein [Clostridiales bacterium]